MVLKPEYSLVLEISAEDNLQSERGVFLQVQTSVFQPAEPHMLQPKKILHHLLICLAVFGFQFPGHCLIGISSCPL